ELNQGYADASLRSMRLLAVYFPGVTLIGNLAVGAVLLYGGVRGIDHAMPVGVLVTFLLLLRRFFEPLQDVSHFSSPFRPAAAALEKLSGGLEEPPSVPEPEAPVRLPRRPESSEPGRRLELSSIRFGYRDAVVLPHLNLTIPAGQTLALVG